MARSKSIVEIKNSSILHTGMFSSTLRQHIRLHSTATKAAVSRFPQLSEITARDIGSSTTQPKFGHGGYFLERSNFGNLPVYIEYKNSYPYTEVRKIQGDIVLLRNDLQEILSDVSKKDFKVLMESKKILIKGNHKHRLVDVLDEVF